MSPRNILCVKWQRPLCNTVVLTDFLEQFKSQTCVHWTCCFTILHFDPDVLLRATKSPGWSKRQLDLWISQSLLSVSYALTLLPTAHFLIIGHLTPFLKGLHSDSSRGQLTKFSNGSSQLLAEQSYLSLVPDHSLVHPVWLYSVWPSVRANLIT